MAEFLEGLRALQSNDNAVRGAAEQRYEQLKREQPALLVASLLQALAEQAVEVPAREQAAVLLRQCLGRATAKGSVWSRLVFEPSQLEVLARLLQLFEQTQDEKVRRKIGDCIQSIGNQLIVLTPGQQNAEQWPQLLPGLMQMVTGAAVTPGLRADSLWVVKELTTSVWPALCASAQQTVQVLSLCLGDCNDPVRANAACLLLEVASAASKRERKPFLGLLPDLVKVVAQLADGMDPQYLKAVLQSLALLGEEVAGLCGESSTLLTLTTVAKSHPDPEARRLALEVLCAAVEAKPKKGQQYVGPIVEVCVQFLQELEEEVQEEEDEQQHHFGAEVVDRLGAALQEAGCFELAAILDPNLAQAGWKGQVAALVMARQLLEYEEDEEALEKLLRSAAACLAGGHPRVRHAAWGCLQQLAVDQEDFMALDTWAPELLPAVLAGLGDPVERVVLACMQAFHHYGEAVEREALSPFVEPLMEAFGKQLQQPCAAIRKEAITCIAVLAGKMQEGFRKYYDALMPVLRQLVAASMHRPEERELLGKAFECISMLANVAGQERFKGDAEEILRAMVLAARDSSIGADDPVQEYVLSAAERICATMKEAFLPFLAELLPTVLARLALAPRELEGDAATNLAEEDGEVQLSVVAGEDGAAKVMIMNNSEVEDVQHAVECVKTFVESLGRAYLPFVSPTAQALLPAFEFAMTEEARDMAFETWGQLCSCAREAGQPQMVAELVSGFMSRVLPKLEGKAALLEDPAALKTRADGAAACLREAGPGVLAAREANHLCRVALQLVESSFARRQGAASAEAEAEEEDDEEEEGDPDDEEEQELRQAAFNSLSAVMSHHPDLFLVEGLPLALPLLQGLLQPSRPSGDRRLGLYFASSLCEHLEHGAVPHWPAFLPQVLQDVGCKEAALRAPACFAASFAARQAAFGPQALDTARVLVEVIAHARSRGTKGKSAQMAADNALSALLEILTHHEGALAAAAGKFWTAWLAGLPCQQDDAEGMRNHGALLQFAQKQKAEVLGPGGESAPRVLQILVEVYRTKMADDVTSWGIGQLIASAGQGRLESCASTFTEKQRKKLVKIARDAQQPGGK